MEPLEWVARLEAKLASQRQHAQFYDRYYSGESRLEIVTRDFMDVFGGMFDAVRENISLVSVEATAERLRVSGFRVGADTEDDVDGARLASDIWRRNDMEEMSPVAHTEIGVKGMVFGMAWPGDDDRVTLSVEDPEQMAVARSSSPPYDVIAALKVWVDEWDGVEHSDLYLPDRVHRFRSASPMSPLSPLPLFVPGPLGASISVLPRWVPGVFDGGGETIVNPFGVVPVVELANRARLLKPPASDLVNIAPLADGADKILADLVIAASFGAVPVRTATGLKFQTDAEGQPVDAQGNRTTPFNVRADRVWISPDAQSKFGTLEGSSLEGFVVARDAILRGVRTISRTPFHYFDMGGTSSLSGDTLKALEGPLVRQIMSRQPRLGSGWRKLMRLALALERPGSGAVETRWQDTETRNEAAAADAAVKWKDAGVPYEMRLEKLLGFTPDEVARAVRLSEAEQLAGDALFAALERDALDPTPRSTVNAEPSPDEVAKQANAAGTLIRSGFDPRQALIAVGLDPIKHLGLLPVTVQAPR
jgi:hypothetical protein